MPTPTSAPGTCVHATKQVLAAETVVLHAQQALSRQLSALGAALAKAIRGTGANRGGGSGAGVGSAGGSSGPASAAQLAADQATSDADAAQLTVAQQNLDNAIVRSPISGTVVSVEVSPGTAVAAGSTAFEIAGLDSYQVQTEVPVTDLPALKVGQRASVQADGLASLLTGSVISIGLTPDTSNSPVTYPVTIGLAGQPGGLHPDGFANVTISTGHSRGVSVPTSAVHYGKHGATVTVYAAGRARTVKVTVGTKGAAADPDHGRPAGRPARGASRAGQTAAQRQSEPGAGIRPGRRSRRTRPVTLSGPVPGARPGAAAALRLAADARTRESPGRPAAPGGPSAAAGRAGR